VEGGWREAGGGFEDRRAQPQHAGGAWIRIRIRIKMKMKMKLILTTGYRLVGSEGEGMNNYPLGDICKLL